MPVVFLVITALFAPPSFRTPFVCRTTSSCACVAVAGGQRAEPADSMGAVGCCGIAGKNEDDWLPHLQQTQDALRRLGCPATSLRHHIRESLADRRSHLFLRGRQM